MLFVEVAVCVYFIICIHACICASADRLILKQVRLGKY